MNNTRNPFNPYNRAYERDKCMEDMNYSGRSKMPEKLSVAMAYVPFQVDNTVYENGKALCVGTVFPVLNKPFRQAGCCK